MSTKYKLQDLAERRRRLAGKFGIPKSLIIPNLSLLLLDPNLFVILYKNIPIESHILIGKVQFQLPQINLNLAKNHSLFSPL